MSSKLRVALLKTRELLVIAQDPTVSQNMILEARKIISEALLAEPLRNCDVGTEEEQIERHYRFCSRNKKCLPDCSKCLVCYGRWAQMSYKKEGEE